MDEVKTPVSVVAADGLQNVVSALGTSRDKHSYTTFTIPLAQNKTDLDAMFKSVWLARRIVTLVAKDMTRAWLKLSWDGYDDDEGGAKEIQRAEVALGLRQKVTLAEMWCRLYGGSVIVLCMAGEDYSKPLVVETVKRGTLAHLQVLDRHEIVAEGDLDAEFGTPNYGLPLFYKCTRPGADKLGLIHWTRVVRFDGAELPHELWVQNQMWGDSVLQSPNDSLKNYQTATQSAGSMIHEATVDIIRAEGLADQLSTPAGTENVIKRFLNAMMMKSINHTLLLDKNEEYEQKTTQFAGLTNIIANFLTDMCGAAGIPATKLFGMSPAGLNATGESDTRNYYDDVSVCQETELRPRLLRIYEVLVRSVRGRMPEGFDFKFNPLWQISKTEEATIRKTEADTDAVYLQQGVLTEGAIARELRDRGTYRTLEDADVTLAEELALQPDPVPVVGSNGVPKAAVPPKSAPAAV